MIHTWTPPPQLMTGADIKKLGVVNTDLDIIKANIAENSRLGLKEVVPYYEQPGEIMLLCGGPSLDYFEDDIRGNRGNGMPLVTVNGAYNWCLERDIKPGAQIILDARSFNRRFTEPHIETCKYLVASQCHPELVRSLPFDQTWMWHIEDVPYPVYGGCTVMLRAIPLLIMLGWRKQHIYGFDSCLMDGKHHAYEQKENDSQLVVEASFGGRTFQCHGWMVSQIQEFQELQALISEVCELAVYGDGAIAHLLKTCAQLAKER